MTLLSLTPYVVHFPFFPYSQILFSDGLLLDCHFRWRGDPTRKASSVSIWEKGMIVVEGSVKKHAGWGFYRRKTVPVSSPMQMETEQQAQFGKWLVSKQLGGRKPLLATVAGDFMGDGFWIDRPLWNRGWAASFPSETGFAIDEAALQVVFLFKDGLRNCLPARKGTAAKPEMTLRSQLEKVMLIGAFWSFPMVSSFFPFLVQVDLISWDFFGYFLMQQQRSGFCGILHPNFQLCPRFHGTPFTNFMILLDPLSLPVVFKRASVNGRRIFFMVVNSTSISYELKALFEAVFRNLVKSIPKFGSSILEIQLIRPLSTDMGVCLRMELSLGCFDRASRPTPRLTRVSVVCFSSFLGLRISICYGNTLVCF